MSDNSKGGGGMSDPLGHHAYSIGGCHIDVWGMGPLLIRHGRRSWLFEFSRMFGPTLLRKSDGEPADKQPVSENHPFWKPFTAWQKAGYRHRAVRTRKGALRFYLCYVPTISETYK